MRIEKFDELLQYAIKIARDNNSSKHLLNNKVVIDLEEYADFIDVKDDLDDFFEEVNENLHVLMSFSLDYEFDHGNAFGCYKLIDNYVGDIYEHTFTVQFTEKFSKIFLN